MAVKEQINEEWLICVHGNQTGIVPMNYVKVVPWGVWGQFTNQQAWIFDFSAAAKNFQFLNLVSMLCVYKFRVVQLRMMCGTLKFVCIMFVNWLLCCWCWLFIFYLCVLCNIVHLILQYYTPCCHSRPIIDQTRVDLQPGDKSSYSY